MIDLCPHSSHLTSIFKGATMFLMKGPGPKEKVCYMRFIFYFLILSMNGVSDLLNSVTIHRNFTEVMCQCIRYPSVTYFFLILPFYLKLIILQVSRLCSAPQILLDKLSPVELNMSHELMPSSQLRQLYLPFV